MARKRIDSAKVAEVFGPIAEALPHQPGFYSGAHPWPLAPLLSVLRAELGTNIEGKAEFKRRLEVYRATGRPTLDELGRLLGFTAEYVEGLFYGWYGAASVPGRTDPDFLDGLADGLAARAAGAIP